MSVGERIKKVRITLGYTQQDFCTRIGLKRNSISLVESGKRNISDQAIKSICREFNVDETWLRTGEGEMSAQQTRRDEITQAVEHLMSGETADFKCRLVQALSSLDEKHWVAIENKMREIMGSRTEEPASAPNYEAEARAEAEEFYRQRLIEKKQAENASASPAPASAAG